MSEVVLQTMPLDVQWPTLDPFLFCVHHLDYYPEANADFGPARSLAGRDIGQDFAGIDGWRMYHGQHVPGFPQHPHRGFETVTFARQGLIDHSDSLGAAARFGRGDVQWLTAGSGIVHSEMFPLLNSDGPNTAELFQIWLNLPSANKMAAPHFTMLWDANIPRVRHLDDSELLTLVTVIAGAFPGVTPPAPPPDSWASVANADVAIWHIDMQPGAHFTLPAAESDRTNRVLYVFEGAGVTIAGTEVENFTAAVLVSDQSVELVATAHTECLVLQGRPIAEPVARYGPFVMNTDAEIRQAFEDYRSTQFGGWPWPTDGPVHGPDGSRFARLPNGETETP